LVKVVRGSRRRDGLTLMSVKRLVKRAVSRGLEKRLTPKGFAVHRALRSRYDATKPDAQVDRSRDVSGARHVDRTPDRSNADNSRDIHDR
jgi:hypothetical protein